MSTPQVGVRPSAKPSQVQNLDHLRHIISAKPPHGQVNISDPKPQQTTTGRPKIFCCCGTSTSLGSEFLVCASAHPTQLAKNSCTCAPIIVQILDNCQENISDPKPDQLNSPGNKKACSVAG